MWLAGCAATGGLEGSQSHPATLPGQPAGADARQEGHPMAGAG